MSRKPFRYQLSLTLNSNHYYPAADVVFCGVGFFYRNHQLSIKGSVKFYNEQEGILMYSFEVISANCGQLAVYLTYRSLAHQRDSMKFFFSLNLAQLLSFFSFFLRVGGCFHNTAKNGNVREYLNLVFYL